MNKETRQFIFYGALMIVCGVAFMLNIFLIVKGVSAKPFEYFLMAVQLYGAIYGSMRFFKTID